MFRLIAGVANVISVNTLGAAATVVSMPFFINLYGIEELSQFILITTFTSFGSFFCLGADKLILRKIVNLNLYQIKNIRLFLILSAVNFLGVMSIIYLALLSYKNIFGPEEFSAINPVIFFTLCASNYTLTIGRIYFWGHQSYFKYSLLNLIYNVSHTPVLFIISVAHLSITFSQFLNITLCLRLITGLYAFSIFIIYIVQLRGRRFVLSRKILTIWWIKSIQLTISSANHLLNDNLEKILIFVISPAWGGQFIIIQNFIYKGNVVISSVSIPLYNIINASRSQRGRASLFYLSLSILLLSAIFIFYDPINRYIFMSELEFNKTLAFTYVGFCFLLSAQYQLATVYMERKGNLRTTTIYEMIFHFATPFVINLFNDDYVSLGLFLGLYLVRSTIVTFIRMHASNVYPQLHDKTVHYFSISTALYIGGVIISEQLDHVTQFSFLSITPAIMFSSYVLFKASR